MLLSLFHLLLFALTAFYVGSYWRFAAGFRRVQRQQAKPPGVWPQVSVVVPARNEATHIEACVRSILASDYPADRFELIVVDDHSTDGTAALVQALQPEAPNLRLVTYEEEPPLAHKKFALEQGLAHATGEILLHTDADCTVGPGWIRAMVQCFEEQTGFVAGPVLFHPGQTAFERVQALEFLGLAAIAAGDIGRGRPNLCNGANAAYRRAAFDAIGGYRAHGHISTGDDNLLMQQIAFETQWQVRACLRPAAVVYTDPLPSYAAVFDQRRRWAVSAGHYTKPSLLYAALAFYFFYVALLIGLPAAVFVPELRWGVGVALALKTAAEAGLLYRAARHFGRTRLLMYIPVALLLYIPHIVFSSTAGSLGGYTWKGRRLKQ